MRRKGIILTYANTHTNTHARTHTCVCVFNMFKRVWMELKAFCGTMKHMRYKMIFYSSQILTDDAPSDPDVTQGKVQDGKPRAMITFSSQSFNSS